MKIENETLLDEFRAPGACEWCAKRCSVREPHHLWAKGMGGGGRLDVRINLIALGSSRTMACYCHHHIHQGEIARYDLRAKVAAREKVFQGDILEVMWLFMRLPKEPTKKDIEEQLVDLNTTSQSLALRELEEAWRMGAMPWLKGPES